MATERSRMRGAKRHSAKPHWNADILRSRLKHYDREPFLELLAQWLECMPEPEVIAKWARAYPDRWVNAMKAISQMSGFADKTESTLNVNVNVSEMSDSQIEDELRRLRERLGDDDEAGPLLELSASDPPEVD